jgi:hypothetical protein
VKLAQPGLVLGGEVGIVGELAIEFAHGAVGPVDGFEARDEIRTFRGEGRGHRGVRRYTSTIEPGHLLHLCPGIMANPDLEARLHLLQHNREAIMVMLAKSAASGLSVDDTVALVADTTDSVGGPMARAMAERGDGLDADAEAARARARDEIPTMVACVPTKLAVELFRVSNPNVSANIAQPVAHGRVRVVVVGAGGSTLVQVPVERLAGGGSA